MTTNASLITETGATIFTNGQMFVVPTDHPKYAQILEALARKDYAAIPDLADLRNAVRKWMSSIFKGDFSLTGDRLTYRTYTFGQIVTQKALAMIDAGNDAGPLLRFLAKVYNNPSKAAREELLLFCEANDFMINEQGNILAYKAVRQDYRDIHSGTVLYQIGYPATMDRGEVDDNRRELCSTGLHFAAHSYARDFGGANCRMLLVEIDPADVVAIPEDYQNQKGRTCKMIPIAELDGPLPKQEVYEHANLTDYERGYRDGESGADRPDADESVEYWDGYYEGEFVAQEENQLDALVDDDDLWDEDNDQCNCSYCQEDRRNEDRRNQVDYELGVKEGRGRRARSFARGTNRSYDEGYTVGRNG